jgi:hypothetical protein
MSYAVQRQGPPAGFPRGWSTQVVIDGREHTGDLLGVSQMRGTA